MDCLNSLLKQNRSALTGIHVVVNSNDEQTAQVIETFTIQEKDFITHECHENVGPAGGFYFGLKRFLEGNWQFAWLMDDDILAEDSCLEHLLNESQGGYIYPTVITAENNEVV